MPASTPRESAALRHWRSRRTAGAPATMVLEATLNEQDVLVVVNAAAGTTHDADVKAAMSVIHGETAAGGHTAEFVTTNHLDELTAALRALGGRRLVVFGGDGTLQAAIQRLHDAGTLGQSEPIGIVPMGTGNDLARYLGLPQDPVAAAHVAMTGTARTMELLLADDGRVTINSVHVGVGAAAASKSHRAKATLSRIGLGRFGYRIGAVAAGATERGKHLEVKVDGEVLHDGDDTVLMVAMGLGPTVGGGAPLVPAANPHDGQVDVVVSLATSPGSRVGFARKLRTARHVDRSDVLTARGEVVEVTALQGDDFLVDGDGEVSGPFVNRRWTVQRSAWRVLVPTEVL